ncbi:MAG: hypothetical protein LBM07_04500 [Culturomica sp.]|jgi:hypothetical protein|nr:hypothetical protein [Culturomica sp.]
MTNLNFNTQKYNSVMPLLMNYTPSTKIEECDASQNLMYDYLKQIIPIEMKIVGTKSLKTSQTRVKNSAVGCGYVNHPDRKNEIDDQKNA